MLASAVLRTRFVAPPLSLLRPTLSSFTPSIVSTRRRYTMVRSPANADDQLQSAAVAGDAAAVQAAIIAGAKLDKANDRGFTPLHFAARYGHAAVARILAERSGNLLARTADGKTALDLVRHVDRDPLVLTSLGRVLGSRRDGLVPEAACRRARAQGDVIGTGD